MKNFKICVALTAILFATYTVAAQDQGPEQQGRESILVLDGSGSMWGQIEGKAKISIAKSVLSDLLTDMPASQRLGLVAYGHRRKGDCGDIEELAPLGSDRATISRAIQGISPIGKTPMADAVKSAAEKLKYTEKKATVILVSDGIETCAPDPCGVAAVLERNGVDFTAHVIGFDVTEENDMAQLRCIAENTGGKFVSASNAGELAAALRNTVTAEPKTLTTTKVHLQATELEGGLVIEQGLNWSVIPNIGAETVTRKNAGAVDIDVEPGSYDIEVVRPSDGLKGSLSGVKINRNTWKTITIALNIPVEASVQPDPADGGMAGTNINVHWTGPDRRGDYISIAPQDADSRSYKNYQYTSRGNPLEIRLPVEPGNYVIRYMLGRPIRELASTQIRVTPAGATLAAKQEAIAGEEVSVEFTGPTAGAGDWITVVAPDAKDKAYTSYYYTKQGSPAKIRMPLQPGDYELRFVQNNKKVLARQAIRVVAAHATLKGPESAIAGEEVAIEFSGPKPASGDWITVVAPEQSPKAYTDYHYTRQGSPATIRMPLEPGNYELRYIQGSKKIIARQAIVVSAANATLSAKESAIAGETVEVAFTGPKPATSDWVTVTAPDASANTYNSYHYTKQGSPAQIRMPLEPGTYELRFIQGGNKILARRTINVTEATATLNGPTSAKAGERIEVTFTGPPAGRGDYIAVAKAGSKPDQYENYGYVSNGSPARVHMPREPGQYELRYIQGNEKLLASAPIEVLPKE